MAPCCNGIGLEFFLLDRLVERQRWPPERPRARRTPWGSASRGAGVQAVTILAAGKRFKRKMKEGGASVRRSVSRPRRAWAWRGMVRCRNRPEAKRRVRLPRRLDAGPGGVRRLWGRLGSPRGGAPWHRLTAGCPTRVFPVRRAFCCFLAGFVVCRRSGRQTCRVGLVMVRGQFRFGHRSPWMAAATMAARLHSSSIASARIAASMARSSPIHHSM